MINLIKFVTLGNFYSYHKIFETTRFKSSGQSNGEGMIQSKLINCLFLLHSGKITKRENQLVDYIINLLPGPVNDVMSWAGHVFNRKKQRHYDMSYS